MNHDIFISYSSKQKSIADGVCHYLEENGFKCWMAPRDIPVGSEYGDLIEEAIKVSKAVVLVFSEAASISKWVKGEINVAFTEDKPILPFRVDETEVKGSFRVMLNMMHWIDAFPHYADRLPDLLSSICGLLGRQARKVNVQNGTTNSSNEKPNQSEKGTNIINGHEYVDLGLPSDTLWATCNVGANKPEEYGDYFAWGETRPKEKYDWRSYKYCVDGIAYKLTKYCNKRTIDNKFFADHLTKLQDSDDAAAANFGNGWHMPSEEQWNELNEKCISVWTNRNGVEGKLFTGINGNSLFLPAAGFRTDNCNKRLTGVGTDGYYWCNSIYIDKPGFALYFCFNSNNNYDGVYYGSFGRSDGRTVRPVSSVKYFRQL